jgi:hypothetical protein
MRGALAQAGPGARAARHMYMYPQRISMKLGWGT